jgi:amino acid transporter
VGAIPFDGCPTGLIPDAALVFLMSETYSPTYPPAETTLPAQEAHEEKEERTDTAVRVVTWGIIILAVVLLIAATIFLVLGVMELIAVVSPILVAAMLAWLLFLSVRVIRLEKRLAERTHR